MNSTVCVDASIVIKLIVEEPGSDLADVRLTRRISQALPYVRQLE